MTPKTTKKRIGDIDELSRLPAGQWVRIEGGLPDIALSFNRTIIVSQRSGIHQIRAHTRLARSARGLRSPMVPSPIETITPAHLEPTPRMGVTSNNPNRPLVSSTSAYTNASTAVLEHETAA